jgi:NADH-quinone oxidoreductase subunit N
MDAATPVLGGFFETSTLSSLLKVVTLLSAYFVLDFSEPYLRDHSRDLLEYATILSFTTFFMLLLVSAAHLMSLFLSLVGFSLGLYVLIMYDASLAPSREAGLKYYYLSALSSGLILYGLILLYITGATGSFAELFILFSTNLPSKSLLLVCTATLIAIIGFFFKLSAVPGHL